MYRRIEQPAQSAACGACVLVLNAVWRETQLFFDAAAAFLLLVFRTAVGKVHQ